MSTNRRTLIAALPVATATALGTALAAGSGQLVSAAQAAADPASAAVSGPAAAPFDVAAGYPQAPYGDQVSDAFKNYLRAAPYIGTAGIVAAGGFEEAKRLGYQTVINLNTSEEGLAEEEQYVRDAGLTYISIQVSTKAPTAEQVAMFADYVNDPANYPILVHCMSANRVGAMWALYRTANGVPAEIAIQEGRVVGLKPSREAAVRQQLGLPALAN